MNALTVADIAVRQGEPTVQDLRLAGLLGFERPRKIRELIKRMTAELARYGEVRPTAGQTSSAGGRPGAEYWLNEGQALLLAIKSDAPNAPDVREQLIRVFMAWRRGELPVPLPALQQTSDQGTLLAAKVGLLRLVEKSAGPRAMLAYMPLLGLAAPAVERDTDAEACLSHLWAWPVRGRPVRDLVHDCFARGDGATVRLKAAGLVFRGDGVVMYNAHAAIAEIYAGTRWRRPFEVIRRLPGVRPFDPNGGGRAGEGTYIPSTLFDL